MPLIRKEDLQPSQAAHAHLETHTILGPEATFEGKLSFQGSVRIDGKFFGEVHTEDTLVVGENAQIEANLQVGAIILHGTVKGNIKARNSVELHAPAQLYGDIETPNLVVHPGVLFQGNCRMEKPDVNAIKGSQRVSTPANGSSASP